MGILWLILIGLVIGIVAKLLMPGSDPGGCIITTLLGVAGALLAPFLGNALNIVTEQGSLVWFGLAVLGSVILLALYRVIIGRRGA